MSPDPDNSQPPAQPGATSDAETVEVRHRKSKIARLPKATRDSLNIMLLDGLSYADILKSLGDAVTGITENNLSRWFTVGGYRDWLKEQRHLQETRIKQEVAIDLAYQDGGSRIHEASLQLAATSASEMLRDFDPSEFKALLQADPAKLIPLLNALARISDAELRCERHRQETEDRNAKREQATATRKSAGLTPESRALIEKELQLM